VRLRKNATPAQVAPARLLAQKPWIVPIPGTTKLVRMEESLGALDVDLTADDLREIEERASQVRVVGERLPEAALKMMGTIGVSRRPEGAGGRALIRRVAG
jgi:diketogulonate reductase-like aldo/keto reductase